MNSDKVMAKITVKGFVQGVGFRYFTYRNAVNLDIKGYVKNLMDGSVYCEAEADSDTINKFISLLRQGPSRSSVSDIIVEYFAYQGNYIDFDIR